MRRPGGYAVVTEPGKPDVERDSFTCCHCNTVVFVKPRQDPAEMGGFCMMCMKHTCSSPTCNAGCTPFERKLEAMERGDRLYRATVGG